LRFDVESREQLDDLIAAPLPDQVRETGSDLEVFRVVHFDTEDRDLRDRGASVRLHISDNSRQTLIVNITGSADNDDEGPTGGNRTIETEVSADSPAELFRTNSAAARAVRPLTDPARLAPVLELEVKRVVRRAAFNNAEIILNYDIVTARSGELRSAFQHVKVALPEDAADITDVLVQHLSSEPGVRMILTDSVGRARELLETAAVQHLETSVRTGREVALVAYDQGRIALREENGKLVVPRRAGSGEDACRAVLAEYFGPTHGRLRYLGSASGSVGSAAIEVWLAEEVARGRQGIVWARLEDVLDNVGTPPFRDLRTLTALNAVMRAGLSGRSALRNRVGRWADQEEESDSTLFELMVEHHKESADEILDIAPRDLPEEMLLNPEIARLLFDERILSIVEHPETPLLERFRFLSMFWSRLDDFFMTRIADFKEQVAAGSTERTPDGLTLPEQLEVTRVRCRHLMTRAYWVLGHLLLPEFNKHGMEIVRWSDLTDAETSALRKAYQQRIGTVITPVITDPTHPFPHIRNLRPAIGAQVRLPGSPREFFVAISLPGEMPRFVPLPDGKRFIPLEELILAVLPDVYRGLEVVHASMFRVTRAGNIEIAEDSGSILPAVASQVAQRPFGDVVRLEVEKGMPFAMRARILRELQYETPDAVTTLSETDVYDVDRFVDLAALKEIGGLNIEGLRWEPLQQRSPLDDRSVFEQMKESDLLVCFPRDSFEETVERFISEAAVDPDVIAIKLTLYRTAPDSRLVRALAEARQAGKDAFALVELKASFDEVRNIKWARSLEESGVHVVYSPANFKVHAKTALVVRREADGIRRYAYIGTGNLNASTARGYIDLGILTAEPELTQEVNEVFNVLTGSSGDSGFQHLLVSPFNMRRRFRELLDREIEHAQSGRGGRIRIQMNGLADRRMIGALYKAAEAGVKIEMAVREICAMRPGVPGVTDNVRVVSRLGRFLEHARIFCFHNAGNAEYFIGSADWRPRNLSKRIEVVTRVRDPRHCETLSAMLDDYLHDPNVWELQSDGSYVRGNEVVGPHTRGPTH
jgi:polyphosphate kinase